MRSPAAALAVLTCLALAGCGLLPTESPDPAPPPATTSAPAGSATEPAAEPPPDAPDADATDPEEVAEQTARLVAGWPLANADALTPPPLPDELDSQTLRFMQELMVDYLVAAHVNARALGGDLESWRAGEDAFVLEEPGLPLLVWITRFELPWRLTSPPRVEGEWSPATGTDEGVEVRWSGRFAYRVSDGTQQRTLVVPRSTTWTLHEDGTASREVRLGLHWSDVCDSHVASALVPTADLPTTIPDPVDVSREVRPVAEQLAEADCTDAQPEPLDAGQPG